jgi:3-phenylpropionate/trans-cinnamate dioxygenase ferredoxin reductase component
MSEQFVIVGAGRAGACAAATLRSEGFSGRVVLVGDEIEPPYNRPPLSKAVIVGKVAPVDDLVFPLPFYPERGIELIRADAAVEIDPARGTVRLASGRSLAYDKLLLATGSRVRTLLFDADSARRIHYLRTAQDAHLLAERLRQRPRVAIIGGGVIGLEVAASAVALGCAVSVIEAGERVMARVIPAPLAAGLAASHAERGVRVLTGARPVQVAGAGDRPAAVVLEGGETVAADLVIAGVGVTAETGLARAAGLAVDDGILTDEYCRTSQARIFAAGDAARFFHPLFERRVRVESWQHAERHAQAAARNMLGREAPYREAPWMWSDQYYINLQAVGLIDDADELVTRGRWEDGAILCFALKDGRLRGATGLGKDGAIGRDIRLAQLMIDSSVAVVPAAVADKLKSLLRA